MWLSILSYILGFIVLVLIILLINYYSLQWSRMGRMVNKLPGPENLPILGTGRPFYICSSDALWDIIHDHNKQYHPIYRVWAPHLAIINMLDPNDIEILLSNMKYTGKSEVYTFLHKWLGKGLLTSKGNHWQNRRKMLTPAFHFNVLKRYMEIFMEHGIKITHDIKLLKNGECLNLAEFITQFTFSTIIETAMGTPYTSLGESAETYRKAVATMGECLTMRFLKYMPVPEWIYYNLMATGRKEKKAIKILHDISNKIIQERKSYHEKTDKKYLQEFYDNKGYTDDYDDDDDNDIYVTNLKVRRKRLAMLDLLIAAYYEGLIDDTGICDEVNTFIFEGHDTVAMALTHTIMVLAELTEIQTKAREEINELWEACNGKLTIKEINKLPYLERCIKETLRLFPSVPYISRQITEDLVLKNCVIPAGAMIQLFIHCVAHNEKFWPDPMKFDPDRFLPEKILSRHPYSYIPFSAGPRNCIGQKYAMLELKTLLSFILHYFQLETTESYKNFKIRGDLVLRGHKPIKVKFIPINSSI